MTGPAKRADIVVREIEVIPNGREQTQVFNGRLETAVQHEVEFPAGVHPRRQQDLGAALSRPAEPGDRRHGRHSAHALRLLRADLLEHLSQRAGARLHEAHQEADAGSARQGRRLHRQRLSAPADLRSSRRRILLVRPGAGQQDPDRLRPDGILRHVEGLRRGPEADRSARSSGWPRSSRRMEAGSRTPPSSTKAPPTATTPTCCASPPTSPGRSRTPATRDRRSRRPGSLSSST